MDPITSRGYFRISINPLCTNGVFFLVGYNKLGMSRQCLIQGRMISKYNYISVSEYRFVFENSAYPDDIPQHPQSRPSYMPA